jgi:AraC family transcriptional regulator
MDDQGIACGHADDSVRSMATMQGGDTQDRDVLHAMHRTDTQEQRLTNKLLSVVSELIEAMAGAVSLDRERARECVHQASAALLSCARDTDDSIDTELAEPNAGRLFRGGLAPWQARSVAMYIDANLNSSVSCELLAQLVRLSVSHFARAFKSTFGCPPHVFLMRRRVQRAQGLMLGSCVPLAQIAVECGFADQAHFSRLFRKFTGERPALWRRARASGAS